LKGIKTDRKIERRPFMKEKRQTRLGNDPLQWIRDSRNQKEANLSAAKPVQKPQNIPKTKLGLKQGWIRATFIVREDYLEKIKALSYWERKDIKQVVDEALTEYLRAKKIKPMPE